MSLADGFMDAIMADFEHVAPSAFKDGRYLELDPAELQPVKDWSTLKALGGDFPKIPPSEYGIPRPNSRQRGRTAEKNEQMVGKIRGMSPAGNESKKGRSSAGWDKNDPRGGESADAPHPGAIGFEDSHELAYSDSGKRRRIARTPAASGPVPGWVYSQGWSKRPGVRRTNVGQLSQDIAASAKRLADKRAAAPFQMGKHYAASFGKLPALERPRPPSYSTSKARLDLDRLRHILVDVSRARIPGPRYCLDPVGNERAPAVNGRRQVQGSCLVSGFSKSVLGKARDYPSVDAFTSSAEVGAGDSVALGSKQESAMRASL